MKVSGAVYKEGEDYSFDSKGTIRILRGYGEACTVTVKRTTPPAAAPSYTLEEIRDELEEKGKRADGRIIKLERGLSARLDFEASSREAALAELKSDVLSEARDYSDNNYSGMAESLGFFQGRLGEFSKRIAGAEEAVSALSERVLADKREAAQSLATLTRDHSALIRVCLDKIGELETKSGELEKRLKEQEAKPSVSPAPRMAAVPALTPAALSSIDKALEETRSALNMETQVRRREDAQLKALLKRLLGKYENLEDWLAGENPDLSASVIADLRAEMRRQDDMLGRVHLENTTRIEGLKERKLPLVDTDTNLITSPGIYAIGKKCKNLPPIFVASDGEQLYADEGALLTVTNIGELFFQKLDHMGKLWGRIGLLDGSSHTEWIPASLHFERGEPLGLATLDRDRKVIQTALEAETLTQVLPAAKGGTGVTSLQALADTLKPLLGLS